MAEQVRYGEGLYLQKGIRLFASVLSAAISGMEVCPVQVEADVSSGLPCFTMVGFPSTQVKEAQDRVRTALKNNGISLPPKKVTVNLAPADLRKEGAGFDLPVAAAVLAAVGILGGCGAKNAESQAPAETQAAEQSAQESSVMQPRESLVANFIEKSSFSLQV